MCRGARRSTHRSRAATPMLAASSSCSTKRPCSCWSCSVCARAAQRQSDVVAQACAARSHPAVRPRAAIGTRLHVRQRAGARGVEVALQELRIDQLKLLPRKPWRRSQRAATQQAASPACWQSGRASRACRSCGSASKPGCAARRCASHAASQSSRKAMPSARSAARSDSRIATAGAPQRAQRSLGVHIGEGRRGGSVTVRGSARLPVRFSCVARFLEPHRLPATTAGALVQLPGRTPRPTVQSWRSQRKRTFARS